MCSFWWLLGIPCTGSRGWHPHFCPLEMPRTGLKIGAHKPIILPMRSQLYSPKGHSKQSLGAAARRAAAGDSSSLEPGMPVAYYESSLSEIYMASHYLIICLRLLVLCMCDWLCNLKESMEFDAHRTDLSLLDLFWCLEPRFLQSKNLASRLREIFWFSHSASDLANEQ